ncbi:MAG: ATP-binding cassette domain-containing protein, partial [Acetobacteraceae bacterium]
MTVTVLDRRPAAIDHASASGAAVALRGIGKAFGEHRVLHDIDLDIAGGEFVAIVGRSGCGKSTLLRLIAGLDTPSEGAVTVDDRADGWRDAVRLMFQEPRLLPWMNAAANVEVGLIHAPRHARRRRAAEVLAQVGL